MRLRQLPTKVRAGWNGDFTASFAYDDLNRLVSGELPTLPGEITKPHVQLTYDPRGNLTRRTEPDGGLMLYEYNSRNFMTAETVQTADASLSYRTVYCYDRAGNQTEIENPASQVTTQVFDGIDRITDITQPEENRTRYEYDGNDNQVAVINGRNLRFEMEYDALNRITAERDPLLATTRFSYDEAGNQTRLIDANGNTHYAEFDELGRLIEETSARGDITTNRYDLVGNLTSRIDPNGTLYSYSYSAAYYLESVLLTNGSDTHALSYHNDPVGDVLWVSDDGIVSEYNLVGTAAPTSGYSTLEHFSDPYGLVWNETVHDGSARTAEYTYDLMQRLTSVLAPSGVRTDYQYNTIGELTGIPSFITGTITYDAAGRLDQYQMANSITVDRDYDANSRMTSLSYTNAALDEIKRFSLGYDGADNITSRNDSSYVYDNADRLINAYLSGGFRIAPEDLFQDTGQVLNDVIAEEVVSFDITEVDLKLDYHAASIGADLGDTVLVTEVELTPLSETHRVEPEHLQLLTANFNIDGGWTETTDFRYERDADGTIRFVLREPITAKYVKVHAHWNELDGNGDPVDLATFVNGREEILTVTYLVRSREEHYSYDGKGNRRTEEITTSLTSESRGYTYYPATDRLKSDGRSGYVYDNNGNLIAKGSVFTDLGNEIDIDETAGEYWEYAHDLLNRLIAVSRLDGTTLRTVASYTYDHRGYRIRRTGDDRSLEAEEAPEVTTTLFTFDTAGRVIEETTGTETVASIFAFGKHLAKVENPGQPEEEVFYYLTDHLGSTVGITDDTGLLLWQDDAVPFGESAGEAGLLDEELKFTGKDVDPATGLYYFNARWYDASTGRFTTEDPIRDGWNWYQYARSNPLRWVDLDGLAPWNLTEEQRDEYKRSIRNVDLDTVPSGLVCSTFAAWLAGEAMEAATGETDFYRRLTRDSEPLTGWYGLYAEDFYDEDAANNISFYTDAEGNIDDDFYSENIEGGTIGVFGTNNPLTEEGGWTGHIITVTGVNLDDEGSVVSIGTVQGHTGSDPEFADPITEDLFAEYISYTGPFVGWGEIGPGSTGDPPASVQLSAAEPISDAQRRDKP